MRIQIVNPETGAARSLEAHRATHPDTGIHWLLDGGAVRKAARALGLDPAGVTCSTGSVVARGQDFEFIPVGCEVAS